MEPIAIATLAFIGTKVGETLVEKFTEAVLPKANALRQKIGDKLKGNPNAEIALKAAENGSKADLEAVAAYLNVAMLDDLNFAEEIKQLAEEIKAGKKNKQGSTNQTTGDVRNNYKSNVISKVEGENIQIGDNNTYNT